MKINSSDSESDSDLFDGKDEDIIDEENDLPHKLIMNIEWKKHLRMKEILIDEVQKKSRIANLNFYGIIKLNIFSLFALYAQECLIYFHNSILKIKFDKSIILFLFIYLTFFS